jgi:DNA-binding helix-hairpin-helix protein with protein kinase domain
VNASAVIRPPVAPAAANVENANPFNIPPPPFSFGRRRLGQNQLMSNRRQY